MRSLSNCPQEISLKRLFPAGQFFYTDDVSISSCSGDWRECRSSDLFVAIVDEEQDGHESAELAIRRGAAAVLGERLLAVDVPQCVVENSRLAFAQICQALAGFPSRELTTIAVTGSDGKTTVSHLLHSILAEAGRDVAIASSLRTSGKPQGGVSKVMPPAENLTPPALASWLRASADERQNHAIVESSSLQLANYELSGMELDAAIITNIRAKHLDYHNSVENYRQVQMRILDHLAPGGIAVLNLDDPMSHAVVDQISCPVMTYAIKQAAELTATPLESYLSEQLFLLSAGNESVPVRTEIIGRHHIYNCQAAASLAMTLGIDLPTIARGLENVHRISGRLDRVECGQEFGVFVDAADSPRRLAATLSTLRNHTPGKLYCVSAIGQGSPEKRSKMGRVLERFAHCSVISAPGCPASQQLELAHQVLDGFDRPAKAQVIPNRVDAIEWSLDQAGPGDCVVVTGFGERPVCALENGRWELNDREICQAWLYQHPISPIARRQPRPTDIFRLDDYR